MDGFCLVVKFSWVESATNRTAPSSFLVSEIVWPVGGVGDLAKELWHYLLHYLGAGATVCVW